MNKFDLIETETAKAIEAVPEKMRNSIEIATLIEEINFRFRFYLEQHKVVDPIIYFARLKPCDPVAADGMEDICHMIRHSLIMAINAQLKATVLDFNKDLEISTIRA